MKAGHFAGDGTSNTTGIILLVALTVILAAMLALMAMGFQVTLYKPPEKIPTIFEIQSIICDSPKYDSRIVLKNIGTGSYENDFLSCNIYINGELLDGCRVDTLNGHNFISTHHFGVQTLGGMGCSNSLWSPSEKLALDLSDSTIKSGDFVRVDVIWKPTGKTISTDAFRNL